MVRYHGREHYARRPFRNGDGKSRRQIGYEPGKRFDHDREDRKAEDAANEAMHVKNPQGLPPARCFLKFCVSGTTSNSNFNMPGFVYQVYSNALVGSNTTTAPPGSRFNYAYTWGNMYQWYHVHASRITLHFNSTGQAGYLILYPTLMGGVGSTLVPTDLDNALKFPLCKYVRFGSVDEGGTNGQVSLQYYVNLKDMVGEEFYTGQNTVGVLPYDGSTGYTPENGTVPVLKTYWQWCFWSTNAVNSGEVAGDLTVNVENFCELNQPCSDEAATSTVQFYTPLQPRGTGPEGRPGQEPDEPLFSVLKYKDGKITQKELNLNPKPVGPKIAPKPLEPDIDSSDDESFCTLSSQPDNKPKKDNKITDSTILKIKELLEK